MLLSDCEAGLIHQCNIEAIQLIYVEHAVVPAITHVISRDSGVMRAADVPEIVAAQADPSRISFSPDICDLISRGTEHG